MFAQMVHVHRWSSSFFLPPLPLGFLDSVLLTFLSFPRQKLALVLVNHPSFSALFSFSPDGFLWCTRFFCFFFPMRARVPLPTSIDWFPRSPLAAVSQFPNYRLEWFEPFFSCYYLVDFRPMCFLLSPHSPHVSQRPQSFESPEHSCQTAIAFESLPTPFDSSAVFPFF